MTESAIYWITRLEGLKIFLGLMVGLGSFGMVLGITGMLMMSEFGPKDKDYRLAKSIFKWSTPFAFLMLAISIFIPTTKEMIAIKVIPRVAAGVKSVSKEDVKTTISFIKDVFNVKTEKANDL